MNLLTTDHAVIYADNDATNRKSSVVYKNVIIAPGAILMNLIKAKKLQKNIKQHFLNNKIITFSGEEQWNDLQTETFTAILQEKNNLVRRRARLKYLFNSRNIETSIRDILEGFRQYKVPPSEVELHQLLISSFVILELRDEYSHENIDSLLTTMTEGVNDSKSINKLDTVTCVTTPFAHESFFKTINVSKVANIFGVRNCLMIVSAPLVYGCEGGAVYDREQRLIGIVINTTFSWNNENAILSLVADYQDIATEFLEQMGSKEVTNSRTTETKTKSLMHDSVVLIQSGASWGTGCLLKINDTKLIITCAHIITGDNFSNVACFWNKKKFDSKVLYKNPKYNHAFDIAILDVPLDISNEFFVQCATYRPVVGDVVYSIGFPYFSTFSTKIDSPSIYEGRITKLSKGMLMSDVNVQAGQSGCPLFMNEALIGICISNCKDSIYDLVYPNISMAVPIYDIFEPLNRYSLTGDRTVLNQLVANSDVADIWLLKPPMVISKL